MQMSLLIIMQTSNFHTTGGILNSSQEPTVCMYMHFISHEKFNFSVLYFRWGEKSIILTVVLFAKRRATGTGAMFGLVCNAEFIPRAQLEEGLSVLQKERNLRLQVEALLKEKGDRLKEARSLQQQDEELCVELCSTPYYIPTGTMPSRVQLQELRQHIHTLTQEKVGTHPHPHPGEGRDTSTPSPRRR